MNLEIEKRTCECGTVEEGIFDKDTGQLLEGTATRREYIIEGKFDKDTNFLIEGKITCLFLGGQVYEGTFDKDTGLLIEGKKTYPSIGQVHEGKFGEGKSLEGKVTYISGNVAEGTFDKDTGRFVEGKVTFPNGKTAYVNDYKEAA